MAKPPKEKGNRKRIPAPMWLLASGPKVRVRVRVRVKALGLRFTDSN
jgi:hypothetical protein